MTVVLSAEFFAKNDWEVGSKMCIKIHFFSNEPFPKMFYIERHYSHGFFVDKYTIKFNIYLRHLVG